jgi:hypothetical protein
VACTSGEWTGGGRRHTLKVFTFDSKKMETTPLLAQHADVKTLDGVPITGRPSTLAFIEKTQVAQHPEGGLGEESGAFPTQSGRKAGCCGWMNGPWRRQSRFRRWHCLLLTVLLSLMILAGVAFVLAYFVVLPGHIQATYASTPPMIYNQLDIIRLNPTKSVDLWLDAYIEHTGYETKFHAATYNLSLVQRAADPASETAISDSSELDGMPQRIGSMDFQQYFRLPDRPIVFNFATSLYDIDEDYVRSLIHRASSLMEAHGNVGKMLDNMDVSVNTVSAVTLFGLNWKSIALRKDMPLSVGR